MIVGFILLTLLWWVHIKTTLVLCLRREVCVWDCTTGWIQRMQTWMQYWFHDFTTEVQMKWSTKDCTYNSTTYFGIQFVFSWWWEYLWCDLRKPVTCRMEWNCKIKDMNSIILMCFFIFDRIWKSATFDTSIKESPSKKFWKKDYSNFPFIWYQ